MVEQHWYICEAIWSARQNPDATNPIEFQATFRERTLIGFIKWSTLQQNPRIDEVWREFLQEFKIT